MSKSNKKCNKKKKNSSNKQITKAELHRKTDGAYNCAIAIMISTVAETDKFTAEDIRELWNKINYKADSISRGYVKLSEIVAALEEEYGIRIDGNYV